METSHQVTLTTREVEALLIALDHYLDPREKLPTSLSNEGLNALLDRLTSIKDGQ